MASLREITQPTCWLLTHMLSAYWRKLLELRRGKVCNIVFSEMGAVVATDIASVDADWNNAM